MRLIRLMEEGEEKKVHARFPQDDTHNILRIPRERREGGEGGEEGDPSDTCGRRKVISPNPKRKNVGLAGVSRPLKTFSLS